MELGQLERRMAPSQLIKQVYASNTIIVNTHIANLLAIPKKFIIIPNGPMFEVLICGVHQLF